MVRCCLNQQRACREQSAKHASCSLQSESKTTGPYDDEETKAFYESLPDVVALVPSTLFNKDPKAEEMHASGTSSPTGAASDTAETGQSQGLSLCRKLLRSSIFAG